ncbi:MAG TPA: glycosyltransferase [Thermoanaerobaculia bacterium]
MRDFVRGKIRALSHEPSESGAVPPARGFDVFCLPIIEWGFRYQRPQQLLAPFARDGHRVFYARTGFLGLDREPTLARVEGVDRVFEVGLPGEFDFNLYRGELEGESLEQAAEAVDAIARRYGIAEAVCLVQYPSWEPLARRLRERHGWTLVYDCMDEHTGFGTHGASTERDEERLVAESDLVLATSKILETRLREKRPDVLRLPNAADLERFSRLPARETSPLARLPRPVVGYYGAIAEWFDAEALALAASRRRGASFVLIGRESGADLSPLDALPNVHRLGEVAYGSLPEHVAAFDVCTIPFRRTPLTEATNPVKLYEYFATGKPVVARRLPEIEPFEGAGAGDRVGADADGKVVELYDTPEQFDAALERALARRPAEEALAARRRQIARENSWEIRYRALKERLAALPKRAPSPPPSPAGRGGSESATSVARRVKEIRRLSGIVAEQQEGIAFLRGEVATRDRILVETDNALRGEIARVQAEHDRIAAESELRRRHLEDALAELDRWDRSRLGRLRRRARQTKDAVASARHALGRATAPGTPLFAVGRALIPPPLARYLRRTLAPVKQKDKMVRLEPRGRTAGRATDALPAMPKGRYDAIVFSIIDWDFRFQRPQQLATQFGRHGHRVFYLSTTQWLANQEGGPSWDLVRKAPNVAELRIRSRRPLDVYKGALDAADLDVLVDAFDALAADLAMGDAVSLVQIPFWAPLAERLRERLGWQVVYDCMDEWTNFPGFGPEVLSREEALVRGADATIVSADRLWEKWKGTAPRLILAKNGIDAEHYKALYGPNDVLDALDGVHRVAVRHPVIGYYGALASWVDAPLLEKIVHAHPEATIVLAGGHFDVDLSRIAKAPNVRLLGQRPYEEMPKLLWNFDVCVIPFLVNDITEATNPVKFYEYLYGGKPVVAPALTELLPYAELSYLARAHDHDEFLAKLKAALAEPADDPRRAARRKVAEENDWAHRYEAIDAGLVEAHPLVSVVVVTYGGLELTKACLDSLLHAETWPRLEVLVVDNAAGEGDGTPEYLRGLALSDPRVRCILNPENRGFAAANNQGVREARGEVIVLLNNDTVVPPGLMGRLAAHLRRDRTIGLLCPTTNFCGNEARVEPDYMDSAASGGVPLAAMSAFAAKRGREHRGRIFDIGVAAMYCVAMRKSVSDQIGPLDEAYGVGMFEDDDFAVRMREAGYRVVCAEDAYVHHVGQGAFRKLSPAEYDALWKKNQAYFEKKWGVQWKTHVPREGVKAVQSKIGEEK